MKNGLNDKLQDPWAIQLLDMVSKDCNVKFSDRFKHHCMAATEYERGFEARCIRVFVEGDYDVGEVVVGGIKMIAAWRPSISTRDEIKAWLRKIYFEQWGQFSPHDPTYFNDYYRGNYVADLKMWEQDPFREGRREYAQFHNAWFDIENCVFWTWEKCNPKDLIKNFRKHVEYLDAERERKRLLTSPKERAHV